MSRKQISLPTDPGRTVRKLFLSAFVVFTFAAYVIYERLIRPDSSSTANGSVANPAAVAAAPAASYKDGTFQGPAVDAYYGLVQVQVDIQGGAIQSVQFLQYPNDRRTSQQINAIAMPYLQQEAVQAQSANVNIISGATLTSQGFESSLQSALQSAQN